MIPNLPIRNAMALGFLAVALAQTAPSFAKSVIRPLKPEQAAQLEHDTITVSNREEAGFEAVSIGKIITGALFGHIGKSLANSSMHKAGDAVYEHGAPIAPARLVADQLRHALVDQYDMQYLDPGANVVAKKGSPKLMAESYPHARYVLDVNPVMWRWLPSLKQSRRYWIRYGLIVSLYDNKTRQLVNRSVCDGYTIKHPNAPTRDQLVADDAQLLKDVTMSLAWSCARQLAQEQFLADPRHLQSPPAEYVDPLTDAARSTTETTPVDSSSSSH